MASRAAIPLEEETPASLQLHGPDLAEFIARRLNRNQGIHQHHLDELSNDSTGELWKSLTVRHRDRLKALYGICEPQSRP